jgi:hypothetical protein
MATKSLPIGIIELVAANLHCERKDFYVGDLRDQVVAAMPDTNKRNEYAALKAARDSALSALPDGPAKAATAKAFEDNLKAYTSTWFKGTVFDSCYAPLKEAQAKGQTVFDALIADMRRNAVGAPPDTFATDVRNLVPGSDAERLTLIRKVMAVYTAAQADDKFKGRHADLFA